MAQSVEQRVLAELVGRLGDENDGWAYLYELWKKLRMSSGTLYVALDCLMEQGVVEDRWAPQEKLPQPRRQYRATSDARVALAHMRAQEAAKPAGKRVLRPGIAPA